MSGWTISAADYAELLKELPILKAELEGAREHLLKMAGFVEKCAARDAELSARVRELEEGLVLALPYVECAEHDEGYKPGVVKKLADSLRALITKENSDG